MFLFDTTAISEFTKRKPDQGFLSWVVEHKSEQSFIATPSIGELEMGIALLGASERRRELERWLDKLVANFENRILSFDVEASRVWGHAVARARKLGRTMQLADSQTAAIARANDLAVVTRNSRHFPTEIFQGMEVINPWSSS